MIGVIYYCYYFYATFIVNGRVGVNSGLLI